MKQTLTSLATFVAMSFFGTFVATAQPRPVVSAGIRAQVQANKSRFAQSFFAHFRNHNQTLYTLEDLDADGTLVREPSRTLVHWDYHSDLYRNNEHIDAGYTGIGNYINTMIAAQHIDEVWWIVPNATRTASQAAYFWKRNTFTDWQFRDGPNDQIICVDAAGRFAYGTDPSCPANGGRPVKFHKRTPNDFLASRNVKIPGPTILDVDADFFDYNGLYANDLIGSAEPRLYSYHPATRQALEQDFSDFLKVVSEKMDLKPDLIACADSPEYTSTWREEISDFFAMIGDVSRR